MESVDALLLAHREGFNVVEVPVRMQERQGGTASNRNVKLLYHYRSLLTIAAGASGHAKTRQERQASQRQAMAQHPASVFDVVPAPGESPA
ncbi:MAG: hypothetical protein R2699_14580 [Acidimicrobiales bacterium]